MDQLDKLRYPIGKAILPTESLLPQQREEYISQIETQPARLEAAISGLTEAKLDTPYRPEGWTVRQLVHHVADSHMNCYIRFKLALTENAPLVKTYEENLWAELEDSRTADPLISLALLKALHQRWVILLRSMNSDDFSKSYTHPELGMVDLDKALALYAWHGNHHIAHVENLKKEKGWN